MVLTQRQRDEHHYGHSNSVKDRTRSDYRTMDRNSDHYRTDRHRDRGYRESATLSTRTSDRYESRNEHRTNSERISSRSERDRDRDHERSYDRTINSREPSPRRDHRDSYRSSRYDDDQLTSSKSYPSNNHKHSSSCSANKPATRSHPNHKSSGSKSVTSENSQPSRRTRNGGDEWEEHVSSSSSKVYYYNRITGESKWDKPDALTRSSGDDRATSPTDNDHNHRHSSRPRHEDRNNNHNSSYQGRRETSDSTPSSASSSKHEPKEPNERRDYRESASSSKRSTAEIESARNNHSRHLNNSSSVHKDKNRGSSVMNGESRLKRSNVVTNGSAKHEIASVERGGLSPSQVTMTNLPQIVKQLKGITSLPDLSGLTAEKQLQTIHQALKLVQQRKSGNTSNTGGKVLSSTTSKTVAKPAVMSSPAKTPLSNNHHHQPHLSHHKSSLLTGGSSSASGSAGHNNRNFSSSSSLNRQQLHHQSADTIRHELDMLLQPHHRLNSMGRSPGSESEASSTADGRSPPMTSSSSALNTAMPTLSASLKPYFKESLVGHVIGWQADHAERQANKYSDEAHNLGSLNCTRVSAELKMARSLVRLTEIQATLQEQRILFVRQQIKDVDEWKSQNASNS